MPRIRTNLEGRTALVVAELAGARWEFRYDGSDAADAERWIDDARHRIRCGLAPRDAAVEIGCPLRAG